MIADLLLYQILTLALAFSFAPFIASLLLRRQKARGRTPVHQSGQSYQTPTRQLELLSPPGPHHYSRQ